MRALRTLALVLLPSLFAATGCVTESDTVGQSEEEHTQTVAFTVLDNVRKSNAPAGLTVIKNKTEYKKFFGETAPASINFNKSWLVHVSVGMRNSGGYSVDVERIDKVHSGSSHKLVVHTVENRPGNDCMVTMAITNPQIAVLINKQPNVKAASTLEGSLEVYSCTVESCDDLGGEERKEDIFTDAGDGLTCVDQTIHCVSTDWSGCPMLSPLPPDFCQDGEVVQGAPHYISGADGLECEMPSIHCVTNDHNACPMLSPRPPNWCAGGEVVSGAPSFISSSDGMECQLPSVYCVQDSVCGG